MFGLLCHIAMLPEPWKTKPWSRHGIGSQRRDVGISTPWNVEMLASRPPGTSRRWISTSQHQLHHPLERRDVGSKRRDVGFIPSLSCRDVGSQRRDIGSSTLESVTTLSPNVATLPLFYAQRPSFLSYPRPTMSDPSRTSIAAVSNHPVASTTTSLSTPTPALRPCLEPPSQLSDPRLVPYPLFISVPSEFGALSGWHRLVPTIGSG